MGKSSKYYPGQNIFPYLSCFLICCYGLFYVEAMKEYVPPKPSKTVYNATQADSPVAKEQSIRELETAYARKSPQAIEAFLENWHRKYPANETSIGYLNDTLRTVYKLFGALFKPDLTCRPTGRHSDTLYRYAVVGPRIVFHVIADTVFDRFYSCGNKLGYYDYDKPIRGRHYSVVENFRPQIRIPGLKSLYLTDDYKNILDVFLGNVNRKSTAGNITPPVRSEEERRERWLFLQNYLYVFHGHWGGYWRYDMPPSVNFIILNESLDKAIVELCYNYSGNGLLLHKEASEWQQIQKFYEYIE